jgi:serine/threonine protein kinase
MEFVDGLPMRRFLEVSSSNAAYLAHPPPVPSEDSSISIEADELSTVTEASVSSSLLSWIDGNDEQDSLDPRPRGKLDAPPATLAPEVRATLNRPERTLRLRDVAAQVCDGLSFIHERGLVHRDVKPSNVLVTESGCAKLVDFGLVKNAQSATHTTAVGRVVGTYRYMSPEQAKGGKVDARSDLYALGSVLYEMLCTHPPFVQNQQADLLRAIVHQAPPPIRELNPEADETLSGIAEKLLQKSPAGRFASAEEVARRLRAAGRLT